MENANKPIATTEMKKGPRSKDSCQRMQEAPASKSTIESDFHSKTLCRLAKKAASTCPGGVLSSNAFFEEHIILRKPIEIAAHVEKLTVNEGLSLYRYMKMVGDIHICPLKKGTEIENLC